MLTLLDSSRRDMMCGPVAALLLLGHIAPAKAAENPPSAPPAASTPSDGPAFDIWEFDVDGNTVLDTRQIEKLVYPYLGPGKNQDTVEQARTALEKAYHDAGYSTVLVDIPEQNVSKDAGVVHLQVTEGTVDRLRISGAQYYSPGKIRESVPEFGEGKVPHMPTVQKQLTALAEESGDRNVTPVMRAGRTPGKVEIELQVEDRLPLHGSVEMNGRNTENTTRSRLIGSLRYDNLWQKFHSASLQYQVSPENYDEVEVWSGTYVMPTGWKDTRLAMYGVGIASNTALGATVGDLSVVGSGNIFGARLIKPLSLWEGFSQSLTLGMDYKSFDQAIFTAGQDTGRTPITYVPFLVAFDVSHRGEQSLTAASVAGHFSVRGLGNDQAEFDTKRAGSRADYFYFTGDIKHQMALPYDLRFGARFSGQIADSALISNEQFVVGGSQTVRGYHQTQQLGDSGVNASVELMSPRLAPVDWDQIQNLRLLGFFDAAYLWNRDELPSRPSHYKLSSIGLGMRAQWLKRFTGELDWGYPMNRQGSVDVGNQRVDFRMVYDF